MMKRVVALCALLVTASVVAKTTDPVKIVVVVPTYNNEKWCIRNIESVVCQSYPREHWRMVIVNDCSSDRTSQLIHAYIQEHQLENQIEIIDNAERKGAMRNLYETIHACPDDMVIATLDGDDWLAGPHVLKRLAQEYADGSVWMTYGQFQWYPNRQTGFARAYPDHVMKESLFRSYDWVATHMRTFKAGLFKKIAKEDLMLNGKFFNSAWDLAMMYPMLEMASHGHVRFIPTIMYIYNTSNPICDFKVHATEQARLTGYIRNKPKYMPL